MEKNDAAQTSIHRDRRVGSCYLPARYVLLAAKVANSFVGSLMDGSMPLAITVMVGRHSAAQTASNTSVSADVCPGGAGQQTSSVHQLQAQEGEFDWDEMTQSFVTNAGTYGALLTILLGARLVDLWGPKRLLIYSCFIYTTIHMLVPVFARWSVYALIAFRVLYGLILAPSSPGIIALMAAWFPPDERQLLNSIMNSMVSMGSIVSTSLSGYLIANYGWELVFYLYGSMHLATNMLYVFFVYDTPQQHPRISEEERNYLIHSINKESKMVLPIPWTKIITSKPLWAHISAVVGITWVKFVFNTELPTYLKRMLYYSTENIGYITSAIHATAWFAELFFGALSRWMRKNSCLSQLTTYKIFNAIAMLGPVVTLVAVAQVGCDATLIVALLLLHFAVSSAFMAGSVLNYMDLSINFAPTLFAFTNTISNTMGIASPAVAGILTNNQETLTAWRKIFYISAVASALPYVIFFVYGSTEEQPWNRPESVRPRHSASLGSGKPTADTHVQDVAVPALDRPDLRHACVGLESPRRGECFEDGHPARDLTNPA